MKYAYIKTLFHFGVQLTATDVLRVDGCLLRQVSKMPYSEVMSCHMHKVKGQYSQLKIYSSITDV